MNNENLNIILDTDIDKNTAISNINMSNTNMLNINNKSWEIFPQYVNIMNEYLLIFTNSKKFKKREKDSIYLLKNGFNTLNYVFKTIIRETLNIDKAIEDMKHSIVYYTNFIEQIEENLMYDLNISSNNASIFVYKKTINQIKPDMNTHLITKPLEEIINNIDHLILIYKDNFELLINEYNNYNDTIPIKLMNMAIELCKTYNDNENDYNNKLLNIVLFMNHFPEEKNNKYEYIYLYIKNYKPHELSVISLMFKKSHTSYYEKLMNDSIKNYIKWIIK